jgi:hypothetical protein
MKYLLMILLTLLVGCREPTKYDPVEAIYTDFPGCYSLTVRDTDGSMVNVDMRNYTAKIHDDVPDNKKWWAETRKDNDGRLVLHIHIHNVGEIKDFFTGKRRKTDD